jgi:hypothetical protein
MERSEASNLEAKNMFSPDLGLFELFLEIF